MRRRKFITLFGGAATWPLSVRAQQSGAAKLPRIGFLSYGAGEHALTPLTAGMFTELQRLGWVNGRSAIYELRFAAGDPSRWPGLATDLVDRKVNVIVAGNRDAAKAAQSATATIPIVALADDMEEAGLVASIAHPGSNITGVSIFGYELDQKRLELLVEMVPAARRMAALAASKTRPSVAQVAASPTFPTERSKPPGSPKNRAFECKGLHYIARSDRMAIFPGAVMRGGGCGGKVRLSCCMSIFCSAGSSV